LRPSASPWSCNATSVRDMQAAAKDPMATSAHHLRFTNALLATLEDAERLLRVIPRTARRFVFGQIAISRWRSDAYEEGRQYLEKGGRKGERSILKAAPSRRESLTLVLGCPSSIKDVPARTRS